MAEMSINDMINRTFRTQDGTVLRVNSIAGKDSVNAMCSRCRQEDVYRASMLRNGQTRTCKRCEEIYKHNIGDIVGSYKIYQRLASVDQKYSMLTNKVLPLKDIRFYFGVECLDCGKKFRIAVDKINSKCSCKINSEENKFDMHGIKIEVPEIDRTGKKIVKKGFLQNSTNNSGINQPENGYNDFKGLVNPKSIKDSYKIATFPALKLIGENWININEFKSSSVTGAILTDKIRVQCVKCGFTKEVSRSSLKSLGKCDNCDRIAKDTNRMILTNIDWVGKIKNNLKIVSVFEESNGIKYCTAECLMCHSLHKFALIVFLTQSNIVCSNCAKEVHEVICPACRKMHIKVSPFDMFVGKDKEAIEFICNETGRNVPVEEVAMYQNALLEQDEYCKEYSGKLTLDKDINMVEPFASMLKFKEHYIGTDGEKYHTYMCKKHHKMISLRDDEAIQYQHEYCTDIRMMAYINRRKQK